MRARDLAEKVSNVLMVTKDKLIIEEGFNPRLDETVAIEELADSIANNDNTIREPLKGFRKGDAFVINNGHRRYRAVAYNEARGIAAPLFPLIVEEEKPHDERLADTIISNDNRPFMPVEEGIIFKRLHEHGWSYEKIAKRVGRSYDYVTGRLTLVTADKRLVEAVKTGKMTATAATQAARAISRSERQISQEIIDKAISGDKKANARLAKSDSSGRFFLKKIQKNLLIKWIEQGEFDKVVAGCQIMEMDVEAFESLQLDVDLHKKTSAISYLKLQMLEVEDEVLTDAVA